MPVPKPPSTPRLSSGGASLPPDGESARRLAELRPRFEELRAERIRAESDIERLSRELEKARAEAREAFGTDDEGEIRRMIEAAGAENAARVAGFAETLRRIEAQLGAAEGDA